MTEKSYIWTPEIRIHYPFITEAALSPDGQWVVYAVREPLMTEDKSEEITHLYLAATTGSESIQLTYGQHSNHCPRWSPDGRFLAFLSTRSGKANLYVMRAQGGEAWALTSYDKSSIRTLAWAPDGQSIAFLMPEPPTEAKEKAQKAKDDALVWDVDFDFTHLYRVSFAIGRRTTPDVVQLTRGRFDLLACDWLPDGQQLAITYWPRPVEEDWTQTRLALVNAAQSSDEEPADLDALQDVALVASWRPQPKVSPDGRWIACLTSDQPVSWAFSSRIGLYPVAGGAPRMLAYTPDNNTELVGWSADGQQIYALDIDGVSSQIWTLPATGENGRSENGRSLTNTPLFKGPVATNVGNTILFSGQDLHQPNALYLLDATTGTTRQIVTPPLPENWPEASLPQAEVIRWTSTDGLDIEGIVVYPVDYQPGTAYPLVVSVHGGPAGFFSRVYLGLLERYCDVLSLAERGFVVLQANPRGSGGYGKSFRFANRGDWGGGDYQDIMSGVDTLIEQGVADPDRLGIIGWSYGGFMTSWTITQTDRFKAACVGAGVTNLMSFNGTADIPGFIPDYFDTEFWDDLEPYRQHSALFQVQGVTTPTLIQHGAEDIRVPLSQGRELYNALKRQNIPVEMVIYPRQGHAVTEPRLKMDVRRRAVDWLARWLSAD